MPSGKQAKMARAATIDWDAAIIDFDTLVSATR
jgi:hypothetical protein